jgi:hypothetical protein
MWFIYLRQDYEGKLNFATDCWTAPNHRAYTAITMHLEMKGDPITILLDFVEVARSHSGVALATEFGQVLNEFGIDNKVSFVDVKGLFTYLLKGVEHHLRQRFRQRCDDR